MSFRDVLFLKKQKKQTKKTLLNVKKYMMIPPKNETVNVPKNELRVPVIHTKTLMKGRGLIGQHFKGVGNLAHLAQLVLTLDC